MILNAIATYPDSSVLGYISALLVPRDRWRYSQQRHHLHLLATWLRTECLQIIDGHVTLVSCIGSRTLYRTMFSQKLEFFVHMWAHECGPIISEHTKQHCRNKRWLLLKPERLWSYVSSYIQRLLAELYWQFRLK